ncbi:carboxymuconolactone decarboxylase family protein [Ktedonobacter racemifer]|uniref:Alkylhydroperoxidase like protein, AhpD family n=1 Tax=Ktedonobacter racemifer DSM 44963 TaxID=485913 RepID=D6TU72_KTERA|nr:carboxymuconolactone decarboxylase family protein [Ktedonobacter racemifer]EFH83973.1 alkylhydroperoxidase like protein, AhpD family [Ktedonobacter racemifer DSM 44963]
MTQRIEYAKAAPGVVKAMYQLEHYVRNCGIEHSLLELVKFRASQINGCAYCMDMHTKDARAAGESEQRLYLLSAWRETPFYSEREQAALEWTEALTLLPSNDVPDELYERVHAQFNDEELANLTLAIVAINGWNRFGVGFRSEPGTYQPAQNR